MPCSRNAGVRNWCRNSSAYSQTRCLGYLDQMGGIGRSTSVDWLAERFDTDHDGTISRKELDSKNGGKGGRPLTATAMAR